MGRQRVSAGLFLHGAQSGHGLASAGGRRRSDAVPDVVVPAQRQLQRCHRQPGALRCAVSVQTVEEYTKKPADKLWSYRKGQSSPTEYVLSYQIGGQKWDYKIPDRPAKVPLGETPPKPGQPWMPDKQIYALELPDRNDKNQKIKFERRKDTEGPYAEFVSPDGWMMKADNNIGLPTAGSWGRFLLIVFLNLFHFALWFAGLWFVLHYQWFHMRWGWRS